MRLGGLAGGLFLSFALRLGDLAGGLFLSFALCLGGLAGGLFLGLALRLGGLAGGLFLSFALCLGGLAGGLFLGLALHLGGLAGGLFLSFALRLGGLVLHLLRTCVGVLGHRALTLSLQLERLHIEIAQLLQDDVYLNLGYRPLVLSDASGYQTQPLHPFQKRVSRVLHDGVLILFLCIQKCCTASCGAKQFVKIRNKMQSHTFFFA